MLRLSDPFTEFDRFFARGLRAAPENVALQALRFDDHVELRFDLPGVDPESIDLTVDNHVLTLAADRGRDVPEGATLVWGSSGDLAYRRTVTLARTLDTDALEAHHENGVLRVVIPVADTARPRKVEIGVGGPAIEATASE